MLFPCTASRAVLPFIPVLHLEQDLQIITSRKYHTSSKIIPNHGFATSNLETVLDPPFCCKNPLTGVFMISFPLSDTKLTIPAFIPAFFLSKRTQLSLIPTCWLSRAFLDFESLLVGRVLSSRSELVRDEWTPPRDVVPLRELVSGGGTRGRAQVPFCFLLRRAALRCARRRMLRR